MFDDSEPRDPLEGPLIKLWHFPIFALVMVVFIIPAVIAADADMDKPTRVVCALIVWAGPMALALTLIPWRQRLDEFHKQLLWQAMALAGLVTLGTVIWMVFQTLLFGSNPEMAAAFLGVAPGMYAFMTAGFIRMTERRATRQSRDEDE